MTKLPNGELVAGGSFSVTGNAALRFVGRFDGSQWQPMQQGVGEPVFSLLTLQDGRLLAAGAAVVGDIGVAAATIRAWDGTSWTPFGTPLIAGPVRAMVQLPNGQVVAGGDFNFLNPSNARIRSVARWDGATWRPFGTATSSPSGPVHALVVLPTGDLVAGGTFDVLTPSGFVRGLAQWNGSAWISTGTTLSSTDGSIVRSLQLLPNGDLLAAGRFTLNIQGTTISSIAKRSGDTWQQLENWDIITEVRDVQPMPDGAIYVAVYDGLIRYTLLDIERMNTNAGLVACLEPLGVSTLAAGGGFVEVNDEPSPSFARFRATGSPPVVTAATYGPIGCPGLDALGFAVRTEFNPDIGSPQWQYRLAGTSNWIDLPNGFVAGLGSVSDATTYWVRIDNPLSTADDYGFRAQITNACGTSTSNPIFFNIENGCCNDIDFNNDGSYYDPEDIWDFLCDFAQCFGNTGCFDAPVRDSVDFNNDGSFCDPCDVDDFLSIYSEGPCGACGG